jgi:phosphotransferase system HPr (HPr) family protein
MVAGRLPITNALGLHARAAARFVRLASLFKSQIRVTRGSRTVDGKSILGLLLLAAAKGTEIDLTVEGDDEDEALAAIVALVTRGFEEP